MHAKVKGISPLVAALLLIMVGIAGAVLIYLWFTGFASKSATIPSTAKIELKIEAATINATNDQVTIYLRNVGSVTVDFSATPAALYIYDANTGDLVAQNTSAITQGTLAPGEVGSYEGISVTGNLEANKYYDIKLVVGGVEIYYPAVKATGG